MKRIMTVVALTALVMFVFSGISYVVCGTCYAGEKTNVNGGQVDAAALVPINRTCPVMGGEISKDTEYYAVVNGEKIGFCCAGCVEAFNKDPKKYTDKVKAELAS
ncbi:MAG: hypothetical protein COW11_05600 [Candidatus Omnitrophica bacterium CG12_big_fil_rev_8_21_14_0_65_43_15]|uniref:TRASH domain-containing protein n=1 Tax=Candidatus Taenaricola geysiri TaxID=1974752 RepID=A0A2J0LK77_9BACT|nr:MAG: hypothetical protein AUJ89_01590 [Candidatus Omnitrophica bacterium CG1_02_43_210]PIR65711.1 MAG: hypothetical protein COU52_02855 [Candidatus Omnitrophica bacterium CG10_big_fil_rev_8_21_14_0_10_43_8]PIV11985.1 MAG: hypothetical protein COS48_03180 [Candidatus Omnitrophica bacterium CG03_land_8_20_14_0_80_43_22]PIW66003.1 MAG: hypothetical protein COW11_05600 [Candidatus Omnitrophica bacterium CG12_big_fil_rev_8_21_14_0_65_43_15]PIW80859.1 MAG: hypothetical protein COZ98_00225 [Candida